MSADSVEFQMDIVDLLAALRASGCKPRGAIVLSKRDNLVSSCPRIPEFCESTALEDILSLSDLLVIR